MQNVANWGESLRERREGLGLSPNNFAPHVRVSGETIRRWEKGFLPPADTMRRVDQVLARLLAEQPSSVGLQLEQFREDLESLRRELQSLTEAVQALAGQPAAAAARRPARR